MRDCASIRGEDTKPASAGSLSEILEGQTRKTFELIESYVKKHPQAADAEQAYAWLFQTAREQGWESEAVSLADHYLKQTEKDLPSKDLAAQVRIVGRAKAGKWDEAMLDFERQLAGVRFRTPYQTVDLAQTLAVQAQVAGKPETAREIYQNLSRTLFLNAYVRKLCETKLAKLETRRPTGPESVRDGFERASRGFEGFSGEMAAARFLGHQLPALLEGIPPAETVL